MLTAHGRLDIPELVPLYELYNDIPVVSISDAQRAPIPGAYWVATVHHGLPATMYQYLATPQHSLLFLGRISPEKRPDTAIRVAQRSVRRVRIVAPPLVEGVVLDRHRQEAITGDPQTAIH